MVLFLSVGFPILLSQFPNIPQFRPAGWFCASAGAVVLILQFRLFHGESEWKYGESKSNHKSQRIKFTKKGCCKVIVSLPGQI